MSTATFTPDDPRDRRNRQLPDGETDMVAERIKYLLTAGAEFRLHPDDRRREDLRRIIVSPDSDALIDYLEHPTGHSFALFLARYSRMFDARDRYLEGIERHLTDLSAGGMTAAGDRLSVFVCNTCAFLTECDYQDIIPGRPALTALWAKLGALQESGELKPWASRMISMLFTNSQLANFNL